MIVASSVAFCTFSRPDAVGATCRPNMVPPPRSTIATTMVAARALAAPVRADRSFWRFPRELSLDSSHVKAHRSAEAQKGGVGASGWALARGSHLENPLSADDRGRPVAFALTPGNVADISMAVPLLSAVMSPEHLSQIKLMTRTACVTGSKPVASRLSFHPPQREQFLTRSIARFIGVATLSNASSAVSRTGDAWQHDTTAWPETMSPRSLSSRSLSLWI